MVDSTKYVEATGSLKIVENEVPVRVVVSNHPQRKKEGPLTEQIVRAFDAR